MNEDLKNPWKSKTLWVSVIVAAAPLWPPLGALVAANPEIAGILVGGVFGVLRLVTTAKVAFKKK